MVHKKRFYSHLHSLSLRGRAKHPNTRVDVRLLGPCFKTGRLRPLRQRPSQSAFLGLDGRMAPLAIIRPQRWRYIPGAFHRSSRPTLAHIGRSTPAHVPPEPPHMSLVVSASLSTISHAFDSLFKVLFIFRSLYLCTIGLQPVFSFR
jgi:hypothetical protein